jgi:hypothetical protein
MNKQTLIRLTANSLDSVGKQGIFEGTFNDGILIGKNAQIALQSCSLSRDQDSFTVNSSNNKISFQVSDSGGLHDIFLNNGNYDSDTVFRLLEDIQDKMNDKLTLSNTKEHNSYIEVYVTNQSLVYFNFEMGLSMSIIQSPSANIPENTFLHYSKNNGSNEIIFSGAGTSSAHLTGVLNYTPLSGTRQYIYSKVDFSKGAGLVKLRLDRFITNPDGSEKSGCVIGLLKETTDIVSKLESESSSQKIVQQDYEFAICTNIDGNPASNYMIKHPSSGGIFVDSGQAIFKTGQTSPLDNDILSIRLDQGHILLVVSTSEGLNIILHKEKYIRRDTNSDENTYIQYIGIFGSSNQTRIGNSTFGFNAQSESTSSNFADTELALGATPYPIPNPRPTIYNVIFNNYNLANFLGFSDLNQNPNSIRNATIIFEASNQITKIFSTNTYLIEMLSEQLDSYDSFDGGRKNILAPIPLSDRVINNSGNIHYEPNNLIYINLKNLQEKLIRNLRCRIITNSYEPINIEGIAEICVLVKT